MFNNELEYHTEDLVSFFNSGTIFHYVSSTFLDGYINYVKYIKVYLLEKYTTQGEKYNEKIWKPFIESKQYHTKLYDLNDDILILGKTKYHYYFFWYDCDVSDCSIGRQEIGELDDEKAIKWFDNYVLELIEPEFMKFRNDNREKFDMNEEEELAEGITGFREIPLGCLKGCIKF